MTNGVSFTLVAGAVCAIKFSVTGYSVAAALRSATLNINSTGAKSVYSYSAGQSGGYVDSGPISGTILVVYNGSAYQSITMVSYGDYSD